jgi:DNA processing protein
MPDVIAWAALSRAVGTADFRRLVRAFGAPQAVFDQVTPARIASIPHLTPAAAESVLKIDLDEISARVKDAQADGISLITWEDAAYPAHLKLIKDPPPVLYVRGSPALQNSGAAIIGTRAPTPQQESAAFDMAAALVLAGFPIVSGLALGIDAAAHRGALDADGITWAVLGGGDPYPPENAALAKTIIESGGAVLSEHLPGEPPVRSRLVTRNRIITGLSRAVIVAAAPAASSLHAVRYALRDRRAVYAVPGSARCDDLIARGDAVRWPITPEDLREIPVPLPDPQLRLPL